MSEEVYQQKLEKAVAEIEKHNAKVTNKVDAKKFIECIQNNGATSAATLKHCAFEDLMGCGLPKILAQTISLDIFRKDDAPAKPKSAYVSEKQAAAMTIAELLSKYDPLEADNPVGKRLMSMSKGQPCIAFKDSSVHVESSEKCVRELREGLAPRDKIGIDGIVYPLFKVGERPGNALAENPLYPGRALRGEDCDQTNRSWAGVTDVVRTILWLAVSRTNEVRINSVNDAHNIMDLVVSKTPQEAEKLVRSRFGEAHIEYETLKAEGRLPPLKISKTGRKNDPFFNRTY
jgi:hypothetical protein